MQLNIRDRILLSRLKNKDKEAFVKAYDLYVDPVYRFIYFKVGDKEEAQDLSSAVFLKTWNHIQNNSINDERTLKALIYKIARNTIIDYYRENNLRKGLELINHEEGGSQVEDKKNDLMKQVEINSDFSLVEKKLSELKDEYREIIILRFIEEMSITEIAEVLNKSKGNIRIMTYRALKALRDLMEKRE